MRESCDRLKAQIYKLRRRLRRARLELEIDRSFLEALIQADKHKAMMVEKMEDLMENRYKIIMEGPI